MAEHNLFYYPYASFTNAQLPLLKVAAPYRDTLGILDSVGVTWAIIAEGDWEGNDTIQRARGY
jgi:hypothetical protein